MKVCASEQEIEKVSQQMQVHHILYVYLLNVFCLRILACQLGYESAKSEERE